MQKMQEQFSVYYKFMQSFRILLIHMDVMYASFAGAKTCHAPYLRPVGNKEVDTLRHFSDGFKLILCVVVDFIYEMTIDCNQRLT